MTGSVVTFYSYKGGVGRTSLLANVAVVLGRWGYRVLCVDWDLDAPGLAFYFRPYIRDIDRGLLDLVDVLARDGSADSGEFVTRVDIPDLFGSVDFLPAGAEDGDYVRRVQQLDWDVLYDEHDFGRKLERTRAQWVEKYDVVLVDSRTGITDIGGICTGQLPDTIVGVFTANEQSLRGMLDVVERAGRARSGLAFDRPQPAVVPVLSRFDAREEYKLAMGWRARVAERVAPLFEMWAHRDLDPLKLVTYLTIPYVARWAVGEEIAAVAEPDPDSEQVSYNVHTLAALLARDLDRTDLLLEGREAFVNAAARAGRTQVIRGTSISIFDYDVFLSFPFGAGTTAQVLGAELGHLGLRVFLYFEPDRAKMPPDWQEKLRDALSRSRSLVALIGEGSTRDYQQVEFEQFSRMVLDDRSERRVIIPVLLADGKLPRHGLLSSLQHVELRETSAESVRAAARQIYQAVRA